MPTYSASIKRASSAPDLINNREHCSADPEKLATVGRAVGHQIRVIRNATQYALYTVSEVRQEIPEYIAQMGQVGRQRLAACAPHGGAIEDWTDEQAEHVATALADKGSLIVAL
ncbi:MAG: hypothetical protein ACRDRR_00505 [Pseudonocardiaceae bacterium]